MIEFEKFILDNGLRVIVHPDNTTPIVAINVLYDVGARDENPERTGFAHLFEHLMFGGSVNIPSYDTPLQLMGGSNNAFTTNDVTNYYLTLPVNNIETGFWLESDRMMSLAFTPESLNVQRQVVVEEYKQRYLNEPYGDAWLLLRALAYKVHPYQWPTIGKEIKHIQEASMDEVKAFFHKHYAPNNAILSVAGNVTVNQIKTLSKRWFEPIKSHSDYKRNLAVEPPQTEMRILEVHKDVPANALYMAFHMCARNHEDFYTVNMITDILSEGNSSRLMNELVKKRPLFENIQAYISGDRDPGLMVVSGRLIKGVSFEEAEKALWRELHNICAHGVSEDELNKVKNKNEFIHVFEKLRVQNKSLELAMHELMGDANGINSEMEKYRKVTSEKIKLKASELLTEQNCSLLRIIAK